MGPVRQNPFQRTVRSVHVCALHCAQLLHTILHRTDLVIFPPTPRQSPLILWCLFKGREVYQQCYISTLTGKYQRDHTTAKSEIYFYIQKRLSIYLYTMSQKTSHVWLAITLTHMNGFWYFLAEMLPIK